jgi:hypothetical protein
VSDPALPTLSRALDAAQMASAFEAQLRAQSPGHTIRVGDCRVEAVRHRPGKRCRITYRLSGTEDGRPTERWITGRLLAAERSPARYLEDTPESWPGCAPWRPASWWPEMRMVLHVFPYDPSFPALARLMDHEAVRAEIDARLPAWGWSPPWRAAELRIRPIKYRHGRRCMLRYDVELESPDDPAQTLSIYSKSYPDERSRYVYAALVAIPSTTAATGDGSAAIPRPLAHLDGDHTLWQEAWPGEMPRARAARLGWKRTLEPAMLERVASLIAGIHRSELPAGSPEPAAGVEQLLRAARESGTELGNFLPERARELAGLVARIERAAPPPPATRATLHGTFKLAQLLCRDDGLALVDFDGVSKGDPLLDIGEFVASLVHLEVRDGVPAEQVTAAQEHFLRAYASAVPWPCPSEHIAWYVSVFLLSKLQSVFKKRHATGLRNLPLALARLEAWVDRAATASVP